MIVSVPRRAVAWSQPGENTHMDILNERFQCPEGLLLGRNQRLDSRRSLLDRVSVPRRAVAWSQRAAVFRARPSI